MTRMHPPNPESLRAELRNENLPPGSFEPSVVQFGCDGCPNGHRFVASWLPATHLVEMVDREEGVPRAFVAGNLSAIGGAKTCPTDDTTGEAFCQHSDTLRTVIARSQPFP